MTPLEQTFWCERFNAYMHDFAEHSGIVEHKKAMRESCKLADADLEEFRKRFGGVESKTGALTTIDTPNRNNQTPATTLYPWELLPENVEFCTTDLNGQSCAWDGEPFISEYHSEWDNDKENWRSFKELGLENVPVPDWRLSREKRPNKDT